MKVHLVYFSPGGTTKKTVKNIAKGIKNVEVIEHDMLRRENREKTYNFTKNDLIIIGMPTASKLFGLPSEIISSLNGNDTPFVGAVTCGNGYFGKGLIVLKKAMEARGFKMVAGGGFIGQYSFTSKVATGRPDVKDEKVQIKFGEDIYRKVVVRKDYSFNTKLKIDWPDEGTFSTIKCALISAAPGIGGKLPYSMNELSVSDACIKCRKCVKHCPVEAITLNDEIEFDRSKCIGCYGCANVCPKKAIKSASQTMIKSVNNVVQYRDRRKEPKVYI
ncbi:EFR1 family ferrodoxin [Vallitalea okinawensis]|uniref:EFR1 family ferrodoxin n=1 Tax=Vallitalea okinawensis TaxID=2078660 RepID=UPI001300228F|nr:EFR1 family ferrodoxin [Vallitalea okinawensis]